MTHLTRPVILTLLRQLHGNSPEMIALKRHLRELYALPVIFRPSNFFDLKSLWHIGNATVTPGRNAQALRRAYALLVANANGLSGQRLKGSVSRVNSLRQGLKRAAKFAERHDATVASVLHRFSVSTAGLIVIPDSSELQL